MSFLGELKRRKVIRVAAVYAVVAWLVVQIAATVEEPLNLPGWVDTLVILLFLAAFPIAVIIAWAYELTPDGIRTDSAARGSRPVVQTTDPTLQVGFSDFIVNGKYDMKDVIQPAYDEINEEYGLNEQQE